MKIHRGEQPEQPLKNKSHEDKLMKLELSTQRYKRSRRDMIGTFEIMKAIFDKETCENLFELRTD